MSRLIKALIFDFDGLILDTEGPIYQAWQEIYHRYGCTLPLEKWASVIGTYEEPFDPVLYLQELVAQPLDRGTILQEHARREAELITRQPIQPGVIAYLHEARRLGLKIGLASSSPCQWVTGHLKRFELLEFFDCIRGREDVQITKPDPELYRSAAVGLGVEPEQAIALEDSPNGVTAAKRAGMFCVAVPNALTRQLPLEHADLRLESLEALPLRELIAIAQNRKP